MMCRLSDICEYANERIDVAALNSRIYISTDNMIQNKGGIKIAASLPNLAQTQAFRPGDVLVSNIRPYFKKIWFATFAGGCSNDVLVFRPKSGTDGRFLYYILSCDNFFAYSMSTSKGTKMPRGDKAAILNFEVPAFAFAQQAKIADILNMLDKRMQLNVEINENLAA